MIESTKFNTHIIEAGAVKGHALATEIADYLARKGIPFSEAHDISGACVRFAEEKGLEVHELSDDDLATVDSRIDSGIRVFLTPLGALESRISGLSASPQSVSSQLKALSMKLEKQSEWISRERARFSGMMAS